MAQQVTADALLLTIYKAWYTAERFPNLLFRNSPTVKRIKKNRIGGRDYRVSMLYGRGGAVSGDYTVAVANAASASRNAELTITPGKIFSVFNVGQLEIMAAKDMKGAYVKPLINRMFAATEGARKAAAATFFGYGYGDIGTLPNAVAAAATTATLNSDTVLKLDVGTQFYVVNSTTDPSAAFYDATVRTVSAIDGNTITWTGGGATAGGWAAGSFIEIVGGRDAATLRNMPTGMAAWLPSLGNRSGAGWTTFIGTAFYGVTRSVSTNALAGWFYQRQAGESLANALIQGIKLCRRGGGVPSLIVVNDEDYMSLLIELQAQTSYMQQTNIPTKGTKPEAVTGMNALKYAFSTSWLDKVIDDPYCPQGTAYILDEEVIEFAALSNTQMLDDGIPNEQPGTASVESAAEPDMTFKLTIDDYLNVQGNSTSTEGPASQVSLAVYGNWVVHEPGHCAIVAF